MQRAGIDNRNPVRVNKRSAARRRNAYQRKRTRRRNGAVHVIVEVVVFVIQRSDRRADIEHFRTSCGDDAVDASVARKSKYTFDRLRVRIVTEFVENKIVDFTFRKRLNQFIREVHFFQYRVHNDEKTRTVFAYVLPDSAERIRTQHDIR